MNGFERGHATVLAIGTAVPANEVDQRNYPDYFFTSTNSNHKLELKEKFRRICEKSGIKKRQFYLNEELLKANPAICSYMDPSLNDRIDIVNREVPKLAKAAALKAIKEWGQPKSKITHLVFCTTSGIDMPGADFKLLKLLGLALNVKRVMLYQQGCFGGAAAMRVAKDLAENNPGARVLIACSEITAITFRAPSSEHLDGLVGSALFGDGAGAVILGSQPWQEDEKALFELHWTGQNLLPDSDGAILGQLREAGLVFHLLKDVPGLIAKNIEKLLEEPLELMRDDHGGSADYNNLFWVVHPGGPAIVDQIEAQLGLESERMQATRDVLAEHGNMASATVVFVLDRMRKRAIELSKGTTGDGMEWGVMLGLGPGLTVEILLLKSTSV